MNRCALAALNAEHQKARATLNADHQRALAAVNAEHQRRLHRSNLFTQKQHVVYATLYRKVRIAHDSFASLIGLTIGPNFRRITREDALDYLKAMGIKERHATDALEAYARGDREEAARIMDRIDRTAKRRKAERAFTLAINYETSNDLYLSDAVREQMSIVRHRMAEVSVMLWPDEEERPDTRDLERKEVMGTAVATLFFLMREEIQRSQLPPAESSDDVEG